MTKDRVDQLFEKIKNYGLPTVFAVAFAAQIIWSNYENQQSIELIRTELQIIKYDLQKCK